MRNGFPKSNPLIGSVSSIPNRKNKGRIPQMRPFSRRRDTEPLGQTRTRHRDFGRPHLFRSKQKDGPANLSRRAGSRFLGPSIQRSPDKGSLQAPAAPHSGSKSRASLHGSRR